MYFSLRKRKMLNRLLFLILSSSFFLLVLYISPWVRQTSCIPPLLGRVCSGQRLPWSLFHHLGGNGPWVLRKAEGSIHSLPSKCVVDQVHMISRHAERFPTINAGTRHVALLKTLQAENISLSGSLAFINDWEYFTSKFESLTTTGPYAGTSQAYSTGRKLQDRYGRLVHRNKTTDFWTCGSPRDIDTARHFANGFFGTNWEHDGVARLTIIPESNDRGGDTLTPGDTCLKYTEDSINGHDRGYAELDAWQRVFTKPIAERLRADAQGINFTPLEIYSMMEMCGFEILARGSSPWCQVFTEQEWLDFEYGRDLLHFYRAGPGNAFGGVMGSLWLRATSALIANDAASGVYFSFVHDGDIIPLLATLGILSDSRNPGYLPNHTRKDSRKWKTSDVVPMSGRLIFERVTCDNTGLGGNLRRSYVRLFINDGIVDLEQSMVGSGLANAVGLNQWTDMVKKKGERYGDFRDVCGLSDTAPAGISFLKPQYRL